MTLLLIIIAWLYVVGTVIIYVFCSTGDSISFWETFIILGWFIAYPIITLIYVLASLWAHTGLVIYRKTREPEFRTYIYFLGGGESKVQLQQKRFIYLFNIKICTKWESMYEKHISPMSSTNAMSFAIMDIPEIYERRFKYKDSILQTNIKSNV